MPEIKIFETLAETAAGAAQAFIGKLNELLNDKPFVHISVTGGTLGIATLAAIADNPAAANLPWSRVHIWWGDERFVSSDSVDRNCKQAFDALFRKFPNAILHEMPSTDHGLQLDQAVEIFEAQVNRFKVSNWIPFDLTLLGMGPDGHIASLFPGKSMPKSGSSVVGEADSPKPPSQRISFTYEAINHSTEIWFLVAGVDKAEPARIANSENSQSLPAGRVRGLQKTVWFLDQTAASELS